MGGGCAATRHPRATLIAWLVDGPQISRHLLDLTGKRGASKAKYPMRFGFTPADPQILASASVEHALRHHPGPASISRMGVPVAVFEGTVAAPDGRAMPLRTVGEPRAPSEMTLRHRGAADAVSLLRAAAGRGG